MNITDEMLYGAAPAAAERWLATLPEREDCGHDFSLTFQAAMEPLLARRRKRWRTLVLLAAVVAALAALSLSTVYAGQKDDYQVYAALDKGFASYVIRPEEDSTQEPHKMNPGWIPEGFVLSADGTYGTDTRFVTRYTQREDATRYFRLEQCHTDHHGGTLLGDFQMEEVPINGKKAVLFSETDTDNLILLWSYGPNAYYLGTNALKKEDMLRIAENLKW